MTVKLKYVTLVIYEVISVLCSLVEFGSMSSSCWSWWSSSENRMSLLSFCKCFSLFVCLGPQVKSVINLLFAAYTGDVSALRR